MPKTKRKSVFLIDDHAMLRAGLGELLDRVPGLRVCGEAADARAGLTGVIVADPDIAVVDLSLPGDGFDLLRQLRRACPRTRLLVLSMHEDPAYGARALTAGASGYVVKSAHPDELVAAIHTVLAGDLGFSQGLKDAILRAAATNPALATSPLQVLSDRELEIFRLIGEGHGTKEIAAILSRSVKTVETHRANIKSKLGITKAADVVKRAIEWAHST